MSSPCLGPEFSLDEGGRVQVDLCGPPLDQDWPFLCSARQNNGLHRNADGCLWVAPQLSGGAAVWAVQLNCGAFCTYSAAGASYFNPVASLSFLNFDTCRARSFIVFTDYFWRVTPAATPTITQFHRQVTGVDGGDAGWTLVHTVDSGTANTLQIADCDVWRVSDIPPGASRNIKVGLRVNASIGSGTLNSVQARIGVIGIASD